MVAFRRSLSAGIVFFAASSTWAFQNSLSAGNRQAVNSGSAPTAAPEISPALLWGAVILVVGAVLIFASRRRTASSSNS
ncbi:MAG: hypothetical protein IPJ19_18065 [Planctomycetes bacterium]|nr:hypothetical protein [Planctomycetota bacterium]